MGRRKYDPNRVKEQVRILLAGGFPPVWERLADELDMPTSSLKKVLGYQMPEVEGVDADEPVEARRVRAIIELLANGPMTRTELADALDCGPATVERTVRAMVAAGYDILIDRAEYAVMPEPPMPRRPLEHIWPGGDEFLVAIASDLHFGSIYHQRSALHHFAQYAVDVGCRHILVAGDVTAGIRMYHGQEHELYASGADEQVEAACEGLPRIDGLTWIAIGGNHDESFWKRGGMNVVRRICELRDDCFYAGYTRADVPLAPGLAIRLWHPSGGVPYAISYRAQKGAEGTMREWVASHALDKDEEQTSTIVSLVWGHLHVGGLFFYGPMALVGPGCFEGLNSYLAAKGVQPEIGGAILRLRATDDGFITRTSVQFLRYRPVEDDYKPLGRRALMEQEVTFTLFNGKKEVSNGS